MSYLASLGVSNSPSASLRKSPVLQVDMMSAIRDTPYATWVDSDTPLERMAGSAWNRALKAEAAAVEPYITATRGRAHTYSAAYKKIQDSTEYYTYILSGLVRVCVIDRFTVRWCFIGPAPEEPIEARTVIVSPCGAYVLSTENDVTQSKSGNEDYSIVCYCAKTQKKLWTLHHVGDSIAIHAGRVYYTLIKNKLWNYGVGSCDLCTGGDRKTVASTDNCRENFYVERGADGVVWIGLEDAQIFHYRMVVGANGTLKKAAGPHTPPPSWVVPPGLGTHYGVDKVWPSTGLLVTKVHGGRILWKCGPKRAPKKLLEIPVGFIDFYPEVWHKAHVEPPRAIPCIVTRPDMNIMHYRIVGDGLDHVVAVGRSAKSNGLTCTRHQTVSHDGTRVHYIVVQKKGSTVKPVRLLISGYGAYAMESSTGMIKQRWGPLIEDGWAVAVGFIRGGGDHTSAWGLAGRRYGRIKTWQDMEAVIRDAQKVCRIGPAQSCIYGRSAGGYLVGALLGRNPEGGLFKGVYTEVPYMDVLQTTTNPGLPLTRIEYGEFGNPAESLADFIFVGLSSPATTAAVLACPNVFVLARTAENDTQVYTYEAIKWVRRLRANQASGVAPKLCIVERGQGHFTPPDSRSSQYGVDAALLETLMK